MPESTTLVLVDNTRARCLHEIHVSLVFLGFWMLISCYMHIRMLTCRRVTIFRETLESNGLPYGNSMNEGGNAHEI